MNTARDMLFKSYKVVQRYLPGGNNYLSQLLLSNLKPIITGIKVVSIFCFSFQQIAAQEIIEMVKMKDQPLVAGKLNGKTAYFLVDSGADITVLNANDTKRYKIRYRKTISNGNMIFGLGSRLEGEILVAINADLYLGNHKVDACFKVLDLSNIQDSIGRSTGIWINGIIGSDIMKHYNFIIDYGLRQIRFTETVQSNTCL